MTRAREDQGPVRIRDHNDEGRRRWGIEFGSREKKPLQQILRAKKQTPATSYLAFLLAALRFWHYITPTQDVLPCVAHHRPAFLLFSLHRAQTARSVVQYINLHCTSPLLSVPQYTGIAGWLVCSKSYEIYISPVASGSWPLSGPKRYLAVAQTSMRETGRPADGRGEAGARAAFTCG
jgi:hypothetical protein